MALGNSFNSPDLPSKKSLIFSQWISESEVTILFFRATHSLLATCLLCLPFAGSNTILWSLCSNLCFSFSFDFFPHRKPIKSLWCSRKLKTIEFLFSYYLISLFIWISHKSSLQFFVFISSLLISQLGVLQGSATILTKLFSLK